MKTAIDRFGRVVVPKEMRVRLGIEADSGIEIDVRDNEIVIRPAVERSPLQLEEGVLVFAGSAVGDLAAQVKADREKRMSKIGSLR